MYLVATTMDSQQRAKLIKQKDRLLKEFTKEQIKWNEYLQGEGSWAGHEHSLHESQRTKFHLLENKIHGIDEQLKQEQEDVEIEVMIDGQKKKVIICSYLRKNKSDCISRNSPIGAALLKLKKDEECMIETPGGTVTVKRLS